MAILNLYNKKPIVFERGSGCFLFDTTGKKYLDFSSALGCVSLGYGSEIIIDVSKDIIEKGITQLTNRFTNPYENILANKLTNTSGMQDVFFANSGAEAIECAIKIALKAGMKKKRNSIISFAGCFHGRTIFVSELSQKGFG